MAMAANNAIAIAVVLDVGLKLMTDMDIVIAYRANSATATLYSMLYVLLLLIGIHLILI